MKSYLNRALLFPATRTTTIDEADFSFSRSTHGFIGNIVSLRRPVYVLKTMNFFSLPKAAPPTTRKAVGGKRENYINFLSFSLPFTSVEFGNSLRKVLIFFAYLSSTLFHFIIVFIIGSIVKTIFGCHKTLADLFKYF